MAVIISIHILPKAFKTNFHIYIVNGSFFWREGYRLLREFNCRMYVIKKVKKVDPKPLILLFSNRSPISFLPPPPIPKFCWKSQFPESFGQVTHILKQTCSFQLSALGLFKYVWPSPEATRELCISTQFLHQEIRWHYCILRSVTLQSKIEKIFIKLHISMILQGYIIIFSIFTLSINSVYLLRAFVINEMLFLGRLILKHLMLSELCKDILEKRVLLLNH